MAMVIACWNCRCCSKMLCWKCCWLTACCSLSCISCSLNSLSSSSLFLVALTDSFSTSTSSPLLFRFPSGVPPSSPSTLVRFLVSRPLASSSPLQFLCHNFPSAFLSTIKIENRSEKISKKPKISVCTLFSNLDNILKVLMYPRGAFSIMTSFLFDFPSELLYC